MKMNVHATMENAHAITITKTNMKELFLANQVLNDILINGQTTKKAIRKILNDYPKDKSFASFASILVGCELRHHILFSVNFKEELANLSKEEKNLIYLCLANQFFLKKLDVNSVNEYAKSILGDKYSEDIDKLLSYQGQISELIKVSRSTPTYVSMRFNTPTWLIKMWKKHFGSNVCYRILKANNTQANTYICKNNIVNDVLLDEHFKEIDDNVYQYLPKTSIRKHPSYKSNSGLGKVFRVNPVLKKVIDSNINPMLSEWTLLNDDDDEIVKYLYVKSKGEIGINLIVNDTSERANLLRFIRLEKMKNILMFKGDTDEALQVGLTSKQEFILVNPASSSFQRIRLYPDYIFNFKRDNLDNLIRNQTKSLDSLASYMCDGGTLLYTVDTLNKKETFDIVASFLDKHPEFELVEEHQHFPFDGIDVTCYYAILRKKESTPND